MKIPMVVPLLVVVVEYCHGGGARCLSDRIVQTHERTMNGETARFARYAALLLEDQTRQKQGKVDQPRLSEIETKWSIEKSTTERGSGSI